MAEKGPSYKTKGNPAHHRMSNPRTKAYRASCWVRQKAKKAERRVAQTQRHNENVIRWTYGDKTPWEISKHNRRVKREIRRRAEAAAAKFN